MTETVLAPQPDEAIDALRAAEGRPDALREVAASWPLYLEAWAALGDAAYAEGDVVAAYAFCRVGYHRGLDQLRAAGWRGSGPAPWDHPSNRGFLRSLHGLMRAAAAIGEGVEARRCREFLLELDPGDNLRVGAIAPKDLSRRLTDEQETP